MKILNIDFNEKIEWKEEDLLTILKGKSDLSNTKLKKLIKESGLCKVNSKSKKRKSNDASNVGDADNVQ